MASKIKFELNILENKPISSQCKQNDDLTLEAYIYEGTEEVDLTNSYIVIQARKSDSNPIVQDVNINKIGNKIIAELDRDFTRVPGVTSIEIVILKEGKQNTTFTFALIVERSVINSTVQSGVTLTPLEQLQNTVVEANLTDKELKNTINTAKENNELLKNTVIAATEASVKAEENVNNLNLQNIAADNNISVLTLKNTKAEENITNLDTKNTEAVTNIAELETKIAAAEEVKAETERLIATGGAATKGDIATVNSHLEQKALKTELEAERERINNIVAVKDSVDNLETADIRVGFDGKTYTSAGEAVRDQISKNYEEDIVNIIDCTDVTLNTNLVSYLQRSFIENTIDAGYWIEEIKIYGSGDGYIKLELWEEENGILTRFFDKQYHITNSINTIRLDITTNKKTHISIRRDTSGAILYYGNKIGTNFSLMVDATGTTLNISDFNKQVDKCLPIYCSCKKHVSALEKLNKSLNHIEYMDLDIKKTLNELENKKVYTQYDSANNTIIIIFKASYDKYYIGYHFKYINGKKDASDLNSFFEVWRLKGVYIYDKRDNNKFVVPSGYPTLVHADAEWECAIKERGKHDFVGGELHGDELLKNIIFICDGIPITNVEDLNGKSFKSVKIIRTSDLYRCDTMNSEKIAEHYVEYKFENQSLILDQKVRWLVNTICDKSYLTMLGAKRLDSNLQITSNVIRDNEGIDYDVSLDGFVNGALTPIKYSNKVFLYNNKKDFKTVMEVELLKTNRSSDSTLYIHNSSNYNKVYFSFCEDNFNVNANDLWEYKSLYKIDYLGKI